MTVLGIDGCRGGWVVAALERDGGMRLTVEPTIAAALAYKPGARRCFVDMPIGLPDAHPRACDRLARRLLGRRASTIFPVPCRAAVYAADYRDACEVNLRCQGRRLSRQLWNLVPKIIELDRFVRNGAAGTPLYESHPELCFAGLNGGTPLLSKKRETQGREERLRLLEAVSPGVTAAYQVFRGPLSRLGAKPDDLLDAMVLAVSCALPRQRWRTLPDPPERDGLGLPMAITAPAPSTGGAEKG